MKIYRVESDIDGGGPYYSTSLYDELVALGVYRFSELQSITDTGLCMEELYDGRPHEYHNQIPDPDDDLPGWKYLSYKWQEQYSFGFTSIKQLRHWFSKDILIWLLDNHFNIAVYETESKTPAIIEGTKQCAFIKHHFKATRCFNSFDQLNEIDGD